MWKFKASKYKNATPKIPKKQEWISELPVGSNLPHCCGTHIKASATYMAFNSDSAGGGNVGVLPLDVSGRQNKGQPVIQAHAEFVTDFDFNPFDDAVIASGSQDSTVKLWRIPDGGLQEPLCNPVLKVSQEQRKVERVLWHPTAADILAVATFKTVNLYDINSTNEAFASLSPHGDQIQGISWRGDGSSLVTCAKDKIIRILDPRTNATVMEAKGHENIKDSGVTWLGNKDLIISTGFDRMRTRELALRDIRNMSNPLKSVEVDTSTGVFMPFYDEDTDMLFVAGKLILVGLSPEYSGKPKSISYLLVPCRHLSPGHQQGDTCIRFMEITDKDPFITVGNVDGVEQIAGLGMVPKRAMEVMKCEVARLLLLTKNAIIPVPYCVPRKSYLEYHGDLYPDTFAGQPALTADQWKAGENKPVPKMSMDPSKRKSQVSKQKPSQAAASRTTQAASPVNSPSKSEVPSSPASVEEVTSQLSDSSITNDAPSQNGAGRFGSKTPAVTTSQSPTKPPVNRASKPKALAGFHQSKCRHLKGTTVHRQYHIENIRNMSKSIPGESDFFHANVERCAVPLAGPGGLVAILELSKPGRLPDTGVPAVQNGSALMDFLWDPFDNHLLAVGCDDAKIRVWRVPPGGLTETLTEPEVELRGHTEKIYCLKYHPLAANVMASASYDMSVRIWEMTTGEEQIQLVGHTDTIFCLSWSPDGKKLATVCKDGKIRIYDPRNSDEPIKEGSGPVGSRGARCAWVCGGQLLAVTGFDKTSTRVVQILDPSDLSQVLHSVDLQISPSILVPFYDEDTSTLFLTGRGDGIVHAFEVCTDAPYLHPLADHSVESLHQALSFLPKNQCNVRQVEFARALRLTSNSVEPLSFTVPRIKLDYFQDDLYPDTKVTWEPVLTAAEWFTGVNRMPKTISLKPAEMKNLSEAPVEAPKAKKYESYDAATYKTDEQKKDELISAMANKLDKKDTPLPQDLTEGVDDDEWDD